MQSKLKKSKTRKVYYLNSNKIKANELPVSATLIGTVKQNFYNTNNQKIKINEQHYVV